MAEKGNDTETIIREVPVDRATAVKLRKIAAKADRDKYIAACKKSRQDAQLADRQARFKAKMEIQIIKAKTSATEKARAGIAQASPYMICLLVLSFIGMLATGAIPPEATATSSSLLVLVLTALMQNLRSIISEQNGHGEEEDDTPKKPKPKVKD